MKNRSFLILFLVLLLFLDINFIFSQEDDLFLNGKEDIEFATQLAEFGFYDLANILVEKLQNYKEISFKDRNKVKLLKYKILKIKGDKEVDLEKKKKFYKQAIEGYKKVLSKLFGLEKLKIELELGEVLLQLGRNMVSQTEHLSTQEKEKVYEEAIPFLREAEKIFSNLKKESDSAGCELFPKNNSPQEKIRVEYANIRYYSWYGYCRALYFESLCGEPTLNECLDELTSYIWDYEGKLGSYYALLLRGLVYQKLEKFKKAINSFEGVILPLKMVYLFKIDLNYRKILNSGKIYGKFYKIFRKYRINLSKKNKVKSLEKNKWLIIDGKNRSNKFLVIKKDKDLNVYRVITHPKAINLCIQACYYEGQTYNKWEKYSKTIDLIEDYNNFLKKIHKYNLIDNIFGQAALLELAQAYFKLGEGEKALKIAKEIANKRSYWGFMAKRYMLEWGKENPNIFKNAKSLYLVALGLWDRDKYKDAIPHFLKVIEACKSKKDIEEYGLDSLEKLAQCFWFLELYQESGYCYKLLCYKYKNYKKRVKIKNKIKYINIGAKSAYWAYRAFMESYKITNDPKDKEEYIKIREYLTKNWGNSSFALNKVFDQALEVEELANSSNLEKGIKLYKKAIKLYKSVKKEANQYELALVYIGKCYYKIGKIYEKLIKKLKKEEQKDNKKIKQFESKKLKAYKLGIKSLIYYIKYTKRNRIPKIDINKKKKRKEALALGYYYLGKIYLALKNYKKADKYFTILYKKYPKQTDIISGALYYLVRINIINNNLKKAEILLGKLEKEEKENIKKYLGYCYYSLGKKYEKMIKDREKEVTKEKIKYYKKSCNYFLKWFYTKKNPSLSIYKWIIVKLITVGENLRKRNLFYYKEAYKLIKKISNNDLDYDLSIILGKCIAKLKYWEQGIYIFYPIFHKDKDRRRKQRIKEMGPRRTRKPTTSPDDPLLVDYMSQIFTGLASQKKYNSPKRLYMFLLPKVNRDLKDLFNEYCLENNDVKSMFEKYMYLQKLNYWIKDEKMEDEFKEKLKEEFKSKFKKARKNRKKLYSLLSYYENLYRELLDKVFPIKIDVNEIDKIGNFEITKRIRRICMHIGFLFASRLVQRLPKYKNPKVSFGFYDNIYWWKAKYRQLYLIYLRGDKEKTKKLIEALKLIQPRLGGEEISKKFMDLLKKCKEK